MRYHALVMLCLIVCLRRLSGRAPLLPFPVDFLFLLPILCLVHQSRYRPCFCVSQPRGFSSPTLRWPHLSSLPACRICCLLTPIYLQTACFQQRCPETGKNSTASELSLQLITAKDVCSSRHRRRPYPQRYCCVGGCMCRWFPPAQPASVGGRPGQQ